MEAARSRRVVAVSEPPGIVAISANDTPCCDEATVVRERLCYARTAECRGAPHPRRDDLCGQHDRLVRFAEQHRTIPNRNVGPVECHVHRAADSLTLARHLEI